MAFQDQEKARIRHFLGYPSWGQLSNAIQLGYPSGGHPLFLLEQSFNRMLPDGEATIRKDLCECESIEEQLSGSRERMQAKSLGKLHLNPAEREDLRKELEFWKKRLADDLGVFPNPSSLMESQGSAGGINARVQG